MASATKSRHLCLNVCKQWQPLRRRSTVAACAHSSNGSGAQRAVVVELDRPTNPREQEHDDIPAQEKPSYKTEEEMPTLAWPDSELSQPAVLKAVAVEFMAQVLFNFASCSAVATASKLAGDTAILMPWQVMVFHSALLYVLVGATQPISGGHFNPMVSTMMAVWGELPWRRLPLYIGAQLLGSAIGSAVQYSSLPAELQDAAHAGIQAVPSDHTVAQAFMGETAAAFILMFLVCLVGLDKKGDPNKIPAVMCLTIPALIYTVGPVSSMCINPARAFGPALASGFWEHHWIWWTAPFVGGLLAVLPYKYMTQLEESESQA